jgi:hypothetical protein
MAWSADQVAALQAMGLTPFVRMGTPMPSAGSVATAPADRLSLALHRAARGRDVEMLLADLDGLRRDPQRKRQLWPQLRALRRSG